MTLYAHVLRLIVIVINPIRPGPAFRKVDWVYDRIDVIGLHVHVRWVKLTIGLTLETYVRPCAGCCATGGIHPSHHPSGSE
jgi:hypothetical protein